MGFPAEFLRILWVARNSYGFPGIPRSSEEYSIFVKLRTPLVLLTPVVSLARFASLGAKDGIDLLTPVGCP